MGTPHDVSFARGRLCASDMGLQSLRALAPPGGAVYELDVSDNCLRDIAGVEAHAATLRTLLLDGNELTGLGGLPHMAALETLWLNKNRIADLDALLRVLSDRAPALRYLSLLGNPVCRSGLVGSTEAEIGRYRTRVAEKLPTLHFIDAAPVEGRPHKPRPASAPAQVVESITRVFRTFLSGGSSGSSSSASDATRSRSRSPPAQRSASAGSGSSSGEEWVVVDTPGPGEVPPAPPTQRRPVREGPTLTSGWRQTKRPYSLREVGYGSVLTVRPHGAVVSVADGVLCLSRAPPQRPATQSLQPATRSRSTSAGRPPTPQRAGSVQHIPRSSSSVHLRSKFSDVRTPGGRPPRHGLGRRLSDASRTDSGEELRTPPREPPPYDIATTAGRAGNGREPVVITDDRRRRVQDVSSSADDSEAGLSSLQSKRHDDTLPLRDFGGPSVSIRDGPLSHVSRVSDALQSDVAVSSQGVGRSTSITWRGSPSTSASSADLIHGMSVSPVPVERPAAAAVGGEERAASRGQVVFPDILAREGVHSPGPASPQAAAVRSAGGRLTAAAAGLTSFRAIPLQKQPVEVLDVSGNKLASLEGLGSFAATLRELVLDGNDLANLDGFPLMGVLEALDVRNNNLSLPLGYLLSSLAGKAPRLERLSLEGNPVCRTASSGLWDACEIAAYRRTVAHCLPTLAVLDSAPVEPPPAPPLSDSRSDVDFDDVTATSIAGSSLDTASDVSSMTVELTAPCGDDSDPAPPPTPSLGLPPRRARTAPRLFIVRS